VNYTVQPILIAAGGGGSSDAVGARNNADARGIMIPTATKEDLMQQVRTTDSDAGKCFHL
jgi:hypothetical protein